MDTPTEQQKKKGGRPQSELEDHLANNCKEVPELVHLFYLGVVSAQDFGRKDTFSLPENSKKRKTRASITYALVHVFICCGIPFSIIENPFFIEFLHKMRLGYESPTSELLTLDGWTNPNSVSVYNYVILTPDREQYLYALHDYLDNHHTGDFLAGQITDIIKKISFEKIFALVTDNAVNCVKAKKIVMNQFPNIIDFHSCNQIILFFKHFHIVGKLLTDVTTTLQIVRGGLKTYCETRWTSMYEAVSSVSHLRMVLKHVLKNNPNEITNKSVRRNIQSLEFFSNVDKLTKVLKLIKTAITLLETVYWKTITTTTAQIWQNNGGDRKSCNHLLAQMRNYELQKSPYNQEFDSYLETPMIQDAKEFFPLLTGYIVYDEDKVHEMINDSTFLQFEEKEDEINNRRNIPISEIPNHKVWGLIIKEMFNLVKNAVNCLNNYGENSNDSDINNDVNETDSED
ncbi:ribonuclease H-like domain-containing protein [Rhizophagus irregularis DAOM 181602=DAOM 197198]|nr:ribonuclease H-like domain-containing protein [Rhizophagus irregularis DAOM 181602=DAOM 197198]